MGRVWAFARLLERAGALGSSKPRTLSLPTILVSEYETSRPWNRLRSAPASKDLAQRVAHTRKGNRPTSGQRSRARSPGSRPGWRAGIATWKRAAAQLPGLRFHDLRHLAITKLAESEASDATIMSIAGHLDRSMLEHYTHIRAAAKSKAVDGDPLVHSRRRARLQSQRREFNDRPSVYIRVYIPEHPALSQSSKFFIFIGRGGAI